MRSWYSWIAKVKELCIASWQPELLDIQLWQLYLTIVWANKNLGTFFNVRGRQLRHKACMVAEAPFVATVAQMR
jgi:hypothetical protein